jgi:hypothetical protein
MLKDISEMRLGCLNLGDKPALAGTLLPSLITRFRRKHENTTISLHSRSSGAGHRTGHRRANRSWHH